MSKSSQEFLARIGPRPLTCEEARQFQMLRIREAQGCAVAMPVIEQLCKAAPRTQQPGLDDAGAVVADLTVQGSSTAPGGSHA